jgi:trimethylamine--corrinoid protein Co-methyltransferase
MTALLPALAGANMIYGLGMLEMGITLDFGQLVMDNEFAGMIRRVLQGIPVNDETLAVDEIRRVGARGNFLTQEHTLAHMKTLQSQPRLLDRNMRDLWTEQGATDLPTRAREEARRILKTHQPLPVSEDAGTTIRSLIEEAEKKLPATRTRKK